MTWMLIAVGGAFGALARYALDTWVGERFGTAFPMGTMVINVSGSFALGLLFALGMERGILSPEIRPPLLIGFLGAYTTFSTWMLQSWALVEQGAWILAGVNIVGSVALGLIALVLGMAIGRAI